MQESYVRGLFRIHKIYLNGQDAVDFNDEMSLYEYIRGKIEKIKERFPENEVIQEIYKSILKR